MFTPEERVRLREAILAMARADPRVTGGALTGSAAGGTEDPAALRRGARATARAATRRAAAHRLRLALRAARTLVDRTRAALAGGVHGERRARPRARAGVRPPRASGARRPRDGPASTRAD